MAAAGDFDYLLIESTGELQASMQDWIVCCCYCDTFLPSLCHRDACFSARMLQHILIPARQGC